MKRWVPAAVVVGVLLAGGLPALALAIDDDPTPSAATTDTGDKPGRGQGHGYGHDRERGKRAGPPSEPPGQVMADCLATIDKPKPATKAAESRQERLDRKEQRRLLKDECKQQRDEAKAS